MSTGHTFPTGVGALILLGLAGDREGSPRIATRARERYRVAAVKYDRFDAFVLADTLRHEHAH